MVDIRRARKAAGLTQAQVAKRSGVAQPNVAAYETGRRVASPAMVRKLLAAMRPSPDEALAKHRYDVTEILLRHKMSKPRVFGSVAEGTCDADSDLDLLVDAQDDLDLLDIVDAAAEIESLLGVSVDIVTSRSLRPGHEILATAVPV